MSSISVRSARAALAEHEAEVAAAKALAAAANAKANTPAKAPASAAAARKPRTNTNTPTKAQKAAVAPATQATPQSLVAQGLAQVAASQPAAPKAAKAPRSAPATSYILTPKGAAFTPDPNRSRVKHEGNHITWLAIKALFTGDQPVTASQIWATIPAHKDFVGYAVRSGWLAINK